MPLRRLLLAVALLLLLPAAARAQYPGAAQTQITISYHEMIAAGADTGPAFLKIFDRLRRDCELVGKAFARKCFISQININVNANYSGNLVGSSNLNANATIILTPEPADASPASPPSR